MTENPLAGNTLAQVVQCGVICLSMVCNLIHRLLVYQSKEALRACGSVRNLPQRAKQYTYLNLHHTSCCGSLGTSLFLAFNALTISLKLLQRKMHDREPFSWEHTCASCAVRRDLPQHGV